MQAGARQRVEGLAQGFVEDAPHLHRAQRDRAALLLDVAQLLAEEAEAAILLAERYNGSLSISSTALRTSSRREA